ncbi:MAG: ABC transporter ATP-binding protein, partial [Chloroflexi bacterium]|nr:ABC transporter ATP-binding protein [Chloroflexota bacterium]
LGLALAARPALLLLDEPAAGLNQDESHDLATLVGTIKDLGITVWVIEHDMSLVMSACQRVIVLHAGRTIAEGAPAEIAKDREVITVFLGEKFARSQSA